MLLQYVSDLHLEFPENKKFILSNPIVPQASILILAGDIMPFILINKHEDFIDYLAANFKHTYWIPGNHEYYHFDVAARMGNICEKLRENVSLVNNFSVKVDNTLLIFSTLWSSISDKNRSDIECNLNDFRYIKFNGDQFTSKHYNELHYSSLGFIKRELAVNQPSCKKVVVTHHVPTFLHYPEMYKGRLLNEAFGVELSDLINDMQPEFWIYGHHHNNTTDFKIGNTQLVTNQLGYVRYQEHTLFQREKTITL